jgi:hypothetical protein
MYVLNGLLTGIKQVNIPDFIVLKQNTNFDRIDSKDIASCSELEKKTIILIAIRNKFAHNQLPNKMIYDLTNEFAKYMTKNEIYQYPLDFQSLVEH